MPFSHNDTIIALFNYGGGMRGLIPAHIMNRIEERTGLQMAEMVDIFTGPSTGAILNAALTMPHHQDPARPRYTARQMVRFYEREGLKIFPQDRYRDFRGFIHDFNNRTMKLSQLNWLMRHGHYSPLHLGRVLRALYGKTRLRESIASLIIPTYNIDGEQIQLLEEEGESGDSPVHTKNNLIDEGGHAIWLKNMCFNAPGIHNVTPDVYLYDAVMGSTAAPTYFPCHHFRATFPDQGLRREVTAIDGSIFDNPCISYMGGIRHHIPEGKRLIMIVLGTGYTNRSIKKEDWNRYGSLGVVDPVNDLPLINIFFHASESALMDAFESEMRGNLFTFNKSLVSSPDAPSEEIDDASPANLEKMGRFADEIIEENKGQFDAVCELLVANRDRKAREENSIFASLRRRLRQEKDPS